MGSLEYELAGAQQIDFHNTAFLGSSSSFSESPSPSIAGIGSADTSEETAPGGPAEDDAARPNDVPSNYINCFGKN
jgi:hypothetical protein